MVTMSDEDLPASVADGADVSTTSSVADAPDGMNLPDDSSPCMMTSGDVGGVGSADSDSGRSLSSSASPAPPHSTVTHDEWNTNEHASDGGDSGVGANGSTPVDGDSLSLSFDGPVTTGSPAYMLSPPFNAGSYQPVATPMHPSCMTVTSVIDSNGQTPVVIDSHTVQQCELDQDGCTTTDSSGNVMSPGSAAAAATGQQYVVNVHVNAGETFSVRAGDRVQLIHGNYNDFSLRLRWSNIR